MNSSDPDQRPSVAEYFADIRTDGGGAAEYLVPDLAHFYRTSRSALLHRAFALVKDRAAAEDVIQEAFLRLVSEIRSGGPIRSAIKWTNTVLRNIALNHIEHRKVVSNAVVDGVNTEQLAIPLRSPSIEQSLISRERQAALGAALALLNSKERDCLLLFAEGYSYQQIAKKRNVSYASAISAVRRGLRKIRYEMAAAGHE